MKLNPAIPRLLVVVCLPLLALSACQVTRAAEPANPQATPQARAVLDFFHELSARKEGRRIVSGQFCGFGRGASLRLMERVHEKTGHWPGLIGVDYADFARGSLTYQRPNEVATEYWRQGGLVTVMAHLYNPANPKGGGLRDRGVNLGDLLQPNTDTHKRWMQELDLIADGLKELKEAGVVVLWRPFHEMNGGWFWWGAADPEKFIAVWRHMFDYFSKERGLDNLLWVYGPNHGQKAAAYYAGDRYVDLAGLDAYTDYLDPEHVRGYGEVAALPKPFGFTEFGPHNSRNPPGDYDYRRFLSGVEKEFPKTSFFMCWDGKWSLATNQFTRQMLETPSILNREDLPANRLHANREATSRRQAPAPGLLPGLRVVTGPVNGAFVERDGKLLAVYGDPVEKETSAEMVLLAEARRDVTWAARGLAQRGAKVIVPEEEADFLDHPGKFWSEWREKRFHDYAQQTTKIPVAPIPVNRKVKGGDTIEWGGLAIRVVDTPGYTRWAVSYLVELGGRKIAFTGDLVRDDGKLQDLFSLQDAIPAAKTGSYHGWAGRLGELMASLDRIAAEKPDVIVPLRGPAIREPAAAIARLQGRIRAAYSNYLSIDALRWYFKDEHMVAKARRVLGPDARVDWMPMAETRPLPAEIVPISNSRLILAADGSGFLVDCGGKGIVGELRKLQGAGKLTRVEHVFVSHYHDDHTDALPELVAEFGATVHACGSLVDVIERPGDYRLPCLTKNPTRVTARHADLDTWKWKEYRLKIFDYPGQTLHHNALLVERDGGWRAFFVGDSFTPSGIDDYCLQNRNILREGEGYLRCLEWLRKLPEDCLLLNEHVGPGFRFSPEQISRLRETLKQRIPLLADLLPFDDPNYGLDEGWAGFHPYSARLRPGGTTNLEFRILNHSPRPRTFRVTVRAPESLRVTQPDPAAIAPHAEGVLKLNVEASAGTSTGLRVLVADVSWGGGELREWAEAMIEVAD